MADRTSIEWTDASWTPIRARWFAPTNDGGGKERVGWHCEHVSEGCRNCYAESINNRLGTGLDFKPGNLFREERRGYQNGEANLFLDEEMLLAPLRWRRPRKIFVCSMTDLFGAFVPDWIIDRVFAVMALASQHALQVLTKRSDRMRAYINDAATRDRIDAVMNEIAPNHWCRREIEDYGGWPLPNVWLGVSCEDQTRADERVPDLLATPAAVRFVSAEPLLGPTNFETMKLPDGRMAYPLAGTWWVARSGETLGRLPRLDWIIVGGESGPNARPMHPAWARSIRDQCAAAGVAFHFKQWGAWGELDHSEAADEAAWQGRGDFVSLDRLGRSIIHWPNPELGEAGMVRVGKKAAGRLLDGVEHNGMPEARHVG